MREELACRGRSADPANFAGSTARGGISCRAESDQTVARIDGTRTNRDFEVPKNGGKSISSHGSRLREDRIAGQPLENFDCRAFGGAFSGRLGTDVRIRRLAQCAAHLTPPRSGAGRGDPFLDLLWREGLPKVALGPGGESLDNADFATFGADHHYGNTFGRFDASETFQELKTVDSGHIDVTHDEIERSFLDGDKGFAAVSDSRTSARSKPARRSDRSTIFRMTEESSTMSTLSFFTALPLDLRNSWFRRPRM
jgi:hypothetical protein